MRSPLGRQSKVLRAAAEALLPATARLDDAGWERLERTIAMALAQRPARVQRQFRLFLRVLDLSTLQRHRRRFHRLPIEARTAALQRLERAPRLLLRRGLWGLRTLVFMGFYTQPDQTAAIGYHANVRGWQATR